jgi:hypothetical protein
VTDYCELGSWLFDYFILLTPSAMETMVRHGQLITSTVASLKSYFRYTYATGKLRRSYTGHLFSEVAYTRYNVFWVFKKFSSSILKNFKSFLRILQISGPFLCTIFTTTDFH